jgi:hypothetical protein
VSIGGLDFTFGNILLFGVAVFLLMGVISFIKQGLKAAAAVVFVLMVLAFLAGAMHL